MSHSVSLKEPWLRSGQPYHPEVARSPQGFTLVELLCVFGIIGLLSGLLLTAVGSAKAKSQLPACVNNNRQLITAILLYADDHNDAFPENFDGVDLLGGYSSWVAGFMLKPSESTDLNLLTDPRRSLIAPYLGSSSVFKCPGDKSLFSRSYSLNHRINPVRTELAPGFLGGLGSNYLIFRRLSEVPKPSNIFMTLDERSDSINDAYFVVDMAKEGLVDVPASYHARSGAISFADGHVESRKWSDPNITRSISSKPQHPETGMSVDSQWLKEHASVRR